MFSKMTSTIVKKSMVLGQFIFFLFLFLVCFFFVVLFLPSVYSYDPVDICFKLNISDCDSYWSDINRTSNITIITNITEVNYTINQTINQTIDNTVLINTTTTINNSVVTTNTIINNEILQNKTEVILYVNRTEYINNASGIDLEDPKLKEKILIIALSVLDDRLMQDSLEESAFSKKFKNIPPLFYAFFGILALIVVLNWKKIFLNQQNLNLYQEDSIIPPGYELVPKRVAVPQPYVPPGMKLVPDEDSQVSQPDPRDPNAENSN